MRRPESRLRWRRRLMAGQPRITTSAPAEMAPTRGGKLRHADCEVLVQASIFHNGYQHVGRDERNGRRGYFARTRAVDGLETRDQYLSAASAAQGALAIEQGGPRGEVSSQSCREPGVDGRYVAVAPVNPVAVRSPPLLIGRDHRVRASAGVSALVHGTCMSEPGLETSAVEWVIEYPFAERLFQELGIDYFCCGISLERACRCKCLEPNEVLASLRRLMAAASDVQARRDP